MHYAQVHMSVPDFTTYADEYKKSSHYTAC